jgi:hypothetical protein
LEKIFNISVRLSSRTEAQAVMVALCLESSPQAVIPEHAGIQNKNKLLFPITPSMDSGSQRQGFRLRLWALNDNTGAAMFICGFLIPNAYGPAGLAPKLFTGYGTLKTSGLNC